MNAAEPDIARLRLVNQRIAGSAPATPLEVVRWMGMVQAQDYRGALRAVGLRAQSVTESDVERALDAREIVRTWPARGTLHLAPAADIRWMLALLAPRVIAGNAGRFRRLELDEPTFGRSRDVLARALEGGRRSPREDVFRALESAGISTAGQRGIQIVNRLAQEGLLCYGARTGGKHTFALLDEWAPPAGHAPAREEALATLAARYAASHGPATVKDFAWWSGLRSADALAGLASAGPTVTRATIDGREYWLDEDAPPSQEILHHLKLLPPFDEYLLGYVDRGAVLDPRFASRINKGGGLLSPVILVDGRVVGTWRRVLKRSSVDVAADWFTKPTTVSRRAFADAAAHYASFLGKAAGIVDS